MAGDSKVAEVTHTRARTHTHTHRYTLRHTYTHIHTHGSLYETGADQNASCLASIFTTDRHQVGNNLLVNIFCMLKFDKAVLLEYSKKINKKS